MILSVRDDIGQGSVNETWGLSRRLLVRAISAVASLLGIHTA